MWFPILIRLLHKVLDRRATQTIGAGCENRTRDVCLEGSGFAIKLIPHLVTAISILFNCLFIPKINYYGHQVLMVLSEIIP